MFGVTMDLHSSSSEHDTTSQLLHLVVPCFGPCTLTLHLKGFSQAMIHLLHVLQGTNDKQIIDMNNHLGIHESVVEQTRNAEGLHETQPLNPTQINDTLMTSV